MFIKKFEAATLEQALSMVKHELGPNALILSTQTKKGKWFNKEIVEVVAAYEKGKESSGREGGFDEAELAKVFPHRKSSPSGEPVTQKRAKTPYPSPAEMDERKPSSIDRALARYGVSERSRQEFNRRLPFEFTRDELKDPVGLDKAVAKLGAESIRTLTFDGFISKGPWIVLGTAGSGKTSFIVKCAVMAKKRGHSVLLSSLDRRKVFAERELGTYARLVGVPFSSDATSRNLGTLSIVDTPSLELADEKLDETARVSARRSVLLVLDATARSGELIRTVQKLSERVKIAAVCFTKLDLVFARGAIYDVLKETKLSCFSLSQSQSFKSEIQFPEPSELASLIFRS